MYIMIILSILSIIVAISLQPVNNPLVSPASRDPISPILFTRLSSIIFIYSGILNYNVLYIDNIDTGIGIYNGYYQVTSISLSIEIFMYLIGALILMPWYPSTNRNSRMSPTRETLSWELQEQKGSFRLDNANAILSVNGLEHRVDLPTISRKELLNIPGIKNNRSYDLTEIEYKTSSPVLSEYSLILLFTILGGSLLISSSDLISMYLSIELQSFAVYILTSLNRNSETSTSAGLKYFLLGGLSSCLILLGCALVYSYTGITNLDSIYSLVSVPSVWLPDLSYSGGIDPLINVTGGSHRGFLLGIVLIVIGFLFKIAGAPFHNWAPDVYDDSSTIVTTWLTIMPKISILIFLLELESGLFLPLSGSLSDMHMGSDLTSLLQIVKDIYSEDILFFYNKGEQSFFLNKEEGVIKSLLLFSSLLSLIIGTVVGLAQYKIKRLLAYSTISHVGFLLLALGINTEQSIESLIFYILQYSITNLNTFLILLVFGYTFNTLLDKSNNPITRTINNQALSSNKEHHRASDWEDNSRYLPEGLKNPQSKISGALYFSSTEEDDKVLDKEMHTIESNNMDIKYISQLKAQFIYNPILSISLAICLFSMAGIPPLLGFFAKQQVLYSATHSGYFFLSIVAILVSVISASYYLQIIKVIHFPSDKYFGQLKKEKAEEPIKSTVNINNYLNVLYGLKKIPTTIERSGNTSAAAFTNNAFSLENSQLNIESSCSSKDEVILLTNNIIQITNVHSMTISTLTLTILLFMLNPSLILNSSHLLALTIFNS